MNTDVTTARPPAEVALSARAIRGAQRRELALNLGVNLVAPTALFYGLRAAGVDQWWALFLSAVPPVVKSIASVIRRGKVDALGLFTLSILALSVLTSFLSGSPRFMLAKDGWLTGAAGIWILGTLARKPFIHQFVRSVSPAEAAEKADINWRDSPTYRHVLRVVTAVWGVGLLADAGVRVVLAYSLPVDRVPLISTLQYVVLYFALEVFSRVYLRRSSVRAQVTAESGVVWGKK